MTTPAKHDIEKPLALSSLVGIAGSVKYAAAALAVGLVVIINAIPTPPTAAGVAQAVVLGLYAWAAHDLPPAPKGVPAALARWYQSGKTLAGLVAVPLSAIVPLIAQYIDSGEWHNLTARGWMGVVVAVIMVLSVNKLPNREVSTVDDQGNEVSPTLVELAKRQGAPREIYPVD